MALTRIQRQDLFRRGMIVGKERTPWPSDFPTTEHPVTDEHIRVWPEVVADIHPEQAPDEYLFIMGFIQTAGMAVAWANPHEVNMSDGAVKISAFAVSASVNIFAEMLTNLLTTDDDIILPAAKDNDFPPGY